MPNSPFKSKKPKATFRCDVHRVFLERQTKRGGTQLRLCTWYANEVPFPPRLERRDYIMFGENMERRNMKAKGLTLEDVEYLRENMGEILMLMRSVKVETDQKIEDATTSSSKKTEQDWRE